jgi:hypothetical protein
MSKMRPSKAIRPSRLTVDEPNFSGSVGTVVHEVNVVGSGRSTVITISEGQGRWQLVAGSDLSCGMPCTSFDHSLGEANQKGASYFGFRSVYSLLDTFILSPQ